MAPLAPAHSCPPQPAAEGWWYRTDRLTLVTALALASIGLVMVYSASSALAAKNYGSSTHFLQAQALHLAIGLVVMLGVAHMNYQVLQRLAYPGLALVFLALMLVLVPGVGHRVGGSLRWLKLGPLHLQPSELAKLAMVIYLASIMAEHPKRVQSLLRGFLPPLGVALLVIAPILLQPDMGMSVTIMILTLVMLFVGGARFLHLGAMAALAIPVGIIGVTAASYRMKRLMTFWDPWADPQGAGFQIIHSLYAFASGGVTGQGLMAGIQKRFYLPEPHTDFILSVLAEEVGLIGVVLVLGLFLALIWRGVRVSLEARDLFGSYLAMGATLIIGLQAFVNAAVVMSMLPTKGLTMPFISYGGSSLITNCLCVGLILSVAAKRGRRA